jgi:hypothetical protein
MDDIPLVARVVLSTAPMERVVVFDLLIKNGGSLDVNTISEGLRVSEPTARRTMIELFALELVDKQKTGEFDNSILRIDIVEQFRWCLGRDFRHLIAGFSPTRISSKSASFGKRSSKRGDTVDGDSTKLKEKGTPHPDDISFWQTYDLLEKILKHIEKKIGGHPTVLWSGRGYHIIQPIDCPMDLDNIDKFPPLVVDKDVNKAFLQFAAEYLSNNKKDGCNNTSLKSCLLRIPGSLNSKCKEEEGKDPEVKIRQEWDGHRPDFRLLLGSFYSYLVGKRAKELQEREKYQRLEVNNNSSKVINWIERLLQTPLDDYRKYCVDLIMVPYLIVRGGMIDEDQIMSIVMQWADRCDKVEPLRPRYYEFERRVRARIDSVMRDMIPPVSWSRLLEDNPDLAQKLSGREGF